MKKSERKKIEREQRRRRMASELANANVYGKAFKDCRVEDCVTYRPMRSDFYCCVTGNSSRYIHLDEMFN